MSDHAPHDPHDDAIDASDLHDPDRTPGFELLPDPVMTGTLFVVWLLLVNEISLRLALLGLAFGVIIPWFSNRFLPEGPKIRSWPALLRFLPLFTWDLVVSNLSVAKLIVTWRYQQRSAWLRIPLDLTDPFAITTFASIISLTPGTVSSRISPDRRTLLVHALDVDDPAAEIATIKQRYERPMREIFEG